MQELKVSPGQRHKLVCQSQTPFLFPHHPHPHSLLLKSSLMQTHTPHRQMPITLMPAHCSIRIWKDNISRVSSRQLHNGWKQMTWGTPNTMCWWSPSPRCPTGVPISFRAVWNSPRAMSELHRRKVARRLRASQSKQCRQRILDHSPWQSSRSLLMWIRFPFNLFA